MLVLLERKKALQCIGSMHLHGYSNHLAILLEMKASHVLAVALS